MISNPQSHLESQFSTLRRLGMLGSKKLGCFLLSDAIDHEVKV